MISFGFYDSGEAITIFWFLIHESGCNIENWVIEVGERSLESSATFLE